MIDYLKDLFKKEEYLKLALTHKSWVNESLETENSNERLEFLGDAILEYIVSKELYQKFPDKEEGYLTALRANLVNTVNLANVARRLGVGESLLLSKGEEEGGGRDNSSLLADTIEAIIGGLYFDSGLEASEKFIKDNILIDLETIIQSPLKDAKSRLQEYVQSLGHPAPKYIVVKETGPDHNKEFVMEVIVNTKKWGEGAGKNKSEAAQAAAANALDTHLEKNPS